ncbi:MAG: ABC transporter substrate-binding protein [Salinarimonas sp.]|nr:ABC transporter substrate-binding protein [Salinarimonas sp.]
MKKLMLATAASALLVAAPAAKADTVNVGILLGFTGPIESITPTMAAAAELAFSEVNESGLLLDGMTINAVRADSTCTDAAAATSAAERLITTDEVAAIVGADCSGASIAVANNVAIPNGVVMVSPSSTSPALTTIDDDGYFFRTAPSDARQGQVVADIVWERGIETVAVTYTNNDYGRGLSEAFIAAFEEYGGTVVINAAHEDGRADYSAEVGALSAAGADDLVVFGYVDQGGRGIIQASIDIDAFQNFVLADGMFGQSLIDAIGSELYGRAFGTVPGSDLEGADVFLSLAEEAGFDGSSSFAGESYDAAALVALAMQAAGSTDRTAIRDAMFSVANEPGEEIMPGELAKALEILANGGEVNYVGATGVELIGPGEAAGRYRIYEVDDGAFQTIEFR